MPLPRSWYPQLAGLQDVARIQAHQGESDTWPPPGTHVVRTAHPELWGLVVEDSYGSAPAEDVLFHTTLLEFVTPFQDWQAAIFARVGTLFYGPIAGAVATLSQWPVVWTGSRGQQMKWLRTTYRGELSGGVEQFQFKLDLGNPGSDPDLDEAECATLAEQLGGIFTSGFSLVLGEVAAAHKFTEVGVVTMTASEGTDAQGEGGDMEQSFPTQWFMYPTVSRPTGGATGISLPFEVACAVTLQTDHRGPSGRGRFYLPPFSVAQMAALGVYTSNAIGSVVQGVKNWLEMIEADTPYVPVVVSPRRIILNEITSINVGRVPDSQRRRRRSQDEARTSMILGA